LTSQVSGVYHIPPSHQRLQQNDEYQLTLVGDESQGGGDEGEEGDELEGLHGAFSVLNSAESNG